MNKVINIKENKKIKRLLVIILLLIVSIPFAYGFFKQTITSILTSKTKQGELIFYSVRENDIESTKLKKWISKNKIKKGIYEKTYKDKKDTEKFKYILLATGEQKMNFDINISSVEGFKDKILINGKVMPIIDGGVKDSKTYYPYTIIKIEKEPRKVKLGTLNLFDVYRNTENIKGIGVDIGILESVKDNMIKITLFNNKNKIYNFMVSDKLKKEISLNKISNNSLVAINYERKKGEIPLLTTIRPIKKARVKVIYDKLNDDKDIIQVKVNDRIKTFNYKEDLEPALSKIPLGQELLITLKNEEGSLYIDNLLHFDIPNIQQK